MGPSYSHTFSLVDLLGETQKNCCSLKSKPIRPSSKVHKGRIMDVTGGKTRAVVKLAQDQNEALGVLKCFRFGNEVMCRCPSARKGMALVRTFKSQIDKVGRCAHSQTLHKNGHVVVQERVEGEVRTLFSLRGTRGAAEVPECILEFVLNSYEAGGGQKVVGEVEGSLEKDCNGNAVYIVTSLAVHSRTGEFGKKDRGVAGVEEFESWAGVPPGRTAPSAPCWPPTFDAEPGDRAATFRLPAVDSENNVEKTALKGRHSLHSRLLSQGPDPLAGISVRRKSPDGCPADFLLGGSPSELSAMFLAPPYDTVMPPPYDTVMPPPYDTCMPPPYAETESIAATIQRGFHKTLKC